MGGSGPPDGSSNLPRATNRTISSLNFGVFMFVFVDVCIKFIVSVSIFLWTKGFRLWVNVSV